MVKQLKLVITDKDTKDGEAHSCLFCPAALAFRRLVRPGYRIKVGNTHFTVEEGSRQMPNFNVPLPPDLEYRIRKFDEDDGDRFVSRDSMKGVYDILIPAELTEECFYLVS